MITNVFLVQILVYFSVICSANLKKLVVAGLKITSSQWSVSGSLKAKTGYRSWCIWSFSWSICYWLKLYQKSSQWKVGCQDASLKEGRQVYLKDSLLKLPHQETNITDELVASEVKQMEQLIWRSFYCLEVRGKLHQVLIFLCQQINNSRLQLRKQHMQVLSAPNSKSILANGVNRKSFNSTTSSKNQSVVT